MDIELAQALEENKLLESLLYCTKRSCNNCGKVNCENFQRQRKDCCENWVSYKDYITELEQQIEKMKCGDNCKYGYIACGSYLCDLGLDGCNNIPFNCDKWEMKEDVL